MGERLSPREQDVYDLATQGLTIREMADRLYIEPQTVKTYLWTITRKRGVEIPGRLTNRPAPVPEPAPYMTRQQQEVCKMARKGFSTARIAESLGVTHAVARLHLTNARQRAADLEQAS